MKVTVGEMSYYKPEDREVCTTVLVDNSIFSSLVAECTQYSTNQCWQLSNKEVRSNRV